MRRRTAESAPAGAVRVARGHLRAADEAFRRLRAASDGDALHDFRVAMRRLRVAVSEYAEILNLRGGKDLRKALRACARSSGGARDGEVFVSWLATAAARLPAALREPAKLIVSDARAAEVSELAAVRSELRRTFPPLSASLRRSLARVSRRASAERPETFGGASLELVRSAFSRFLTAVGRIRHDRDHRRAHRARIVAKRLRYLIEPITARARGRAVDVLKRVQDRFGAYHDRGAFVEAILALRGPGFGGVSCDPRRVRAIEALLAVARSEERRAFRALARDVLSKPDAGLQVVSRLCGAAERPRVPGNGV